MKNLRIGNIFDPPADTGEHEIFTTIFKSDKIEITKIDGLRAFNKPGKWYDQEDDEWVILLQGKATLEFQNDESIQLNSGDYIFIEAHKPHRIKQSSNKPNCLWLAIHGKLK